MSERDLVVAFKGGDAHAYAVIYRHFRPVAESICLRILGNADDAAEAAQETMLRVFQGLPRFNGRYLLRAWVARIATNVCLDMIRKRGRRIDEVDSPAAEDLEGQINLIERQTTDDPGEVIERLDESARVRRKLQELPDHHRAALLMREFDGLSHEEMALKLGMTPPQVKALLHRAKKGFRRAWEVESGRASSFVFPALFAAPFRWIKRALSPTKDVVADAAAPVLHLSAQPAVAQASAAVGERLSAAAGAILVAGTIGIGASAMPTRQPPGPKPVKESAPVVLADETPGISIVDSPEAGSSPAESLVPSPSPSGSSADRSGSSTRPSSGPAQEPQPSSIPSAEPQPGATPSPSGSPAPASPQPAPQYDMQFNLNSISDRRCECPSQPRLIGNRGTSGKPGESMSFGQEVQGAATEAGGNPAYALGLKYDGYTQDASGSLTVEFRFMVNGEVYAYLGKLSLTSREQVGSTWRYVFNGTYEFTSGPTGAKEPIARSGRIATSLRFWSDGAIYRAVIDLG